MNRRQDGLLKASVKSVLECYRANAQFRASTVVLVLAYSLVAAWLALTIQPLFAAAMLGIGPRILAFSLVPQEFLLYDLLLGKAQPRASLLKMCFDSRLLGYAWRYCVAALAFLVPAVVISMATGWFLGWSDGDPLRIALVVVLAVVITGLVLSLCLRIMFFPIFVAMRQPKALRASFRATKGKAWQATRAMSLPLAVLLTVYLLAYGMGIFAGKVDAAVSIPLVLIEICLIIFLTAMETALLTHTYKRIVAPTQEEGMLDASAPIAADAAAMASHSDGMVGDSPQ